MKKSMSKTQLIQSVWFKGFIILIIIVILSFIMDVVSNHSEYTVTDELQKAEVAVVNDDLALALRLYEEAYAQVPDEQTKVLISEVKALIQSKDYYETAMTLKENQKLETAYSYYQKVSQNDTVRYEKAQSYQQDVAEDIVAGILTEAKSLYDQGLYPLVVGQLTKALDYNVRSQELTKHLEKANEHFYQYYVEEAQEVFDTYLDNEHLFDSFKQSLVYANLFASSEEQKDELTILEETLMLEAVTLYSKQLKSLESENQEKATMYAKMILALDDDNVTALNYLESIE